jgi:two-component system, probable response regulator PhcQ
LNNFTGMPSSVLFVDDEDKARKYFSLAMNGEFNVRTASSAAEALELLELHGTDTAIIVSDQRMPEITGVELLKSVREQYPHIVRLLTTAYTDIEDAIAAINRGEVLRYIQKPWDISTLQSELRQAMHYFQLRHERDSLLEEKLSVRQRLVEVERINQLLLVAETLPGLRFAPAAMRQYLQQIVSNQLGDSSPPEEGFTRLDAWTLTLTESTRMRDFARTLSDNLGPCLAQTGSFPDAMDPATIGELHQLACPVQTDTKLELIVQDFDKAPALQSNRALLSLLLKKLLAVCGQSGSANPARVTVTASIAKVQQQEGLQLVFSVEDGNFRSIHGILSGSPSSPVAAVEADLLLAWLLAVHMGGSLAIQASGQALVLVLPEQPDQVEAPKINPDWHENLLIRLEPD